MAAAAVVAVAAAAAVAVVVAEEEKRSKHRRSSGSLKRTSNCGDMDLIQSPCLHNFFLLMAKRRTTIYVPLGPL